MLKIDDLIRENERFFLSLLIFGSLIYANESALLSSVILAVAPISARFMSVENGNDAARSSASESS